LAETTSNEVVTKNGSKTNLVLPDGTNVFLNSGSKITYAKDYGIRSREVNLVGEAYFDVVKNPAKPFIIHTSKINVRVLGTAFNVRCYPDEKNTETSLIRGSLEVSFKDGREKIMLKPNEKLVINNRAIQENLSPVKSKKNIAALNVFELSHVGLLPQDNSVVETAWVYNRLVFNSETFEDIAHKMEKWYGTAVSFKDEDLKKKKFTGVFEKETIYEALDAIQLTTAFSYEETNGQIILSK
jgi:ferric-dicitrate binding protein FerR (iron transport regulator)